MKQTLAILTLLTLLPACAIRKDLRSDTAPTDLKSAVGNIPTDIDPTKGSEYCSPASDGSFDPEAAKKTDEGPGPEGSMKAGKAGCIVRPIREVWAAFNNLDALKWTDMNSYSATRILKPSDNKSASLRYLIKYHKSASGMSFDWDLRWDMGISKGTFEDPQQIVIAYERQGGAGVLSYWKGLIVLTKVNNSVTEIRVNNAIHANLLADELQGQSWIAVMEMIAVGRNAKPDWKNLNLGFKDHPEEPDQATKSKVKTSVHYCEKDANGNYPTEMSESASSTDLVTSVVLISCVKLTPEDLQSRLNAIEGLRWKNADFAAVKDNGDTKHVGYEHTFLLFKKTWNMDWTFKPTEQGFDVDYKLLSATMDFPHWQGSIKIKALEGGYSQVMMSDEFLGDQISTSLQTNQSLTKSFLYNLTFIPTGEEDKGFQFEGP